MIVRMIRSSKLLSSFSVSTICSFPKYLRYRQTQTSSGNLENIQLRFGSTRRYPFVKIIPNIKVSYKGAQFLHLVCQGERSVPFPPSVTLLTVLRKVLSETLLGYFVAPTIIRRPGNCAPLAPSLRLCRSRRQRGDNGALPPFKLCAPHFMFGHRPTTKL